MSDINFVYLAFGSASVFHVQTYFSALTVLRHKRTADKVMIRQLLGILLDNAIKYTGDNKKITINLIKKRLSLQIKVKDNGIGIKKEDLSHIFDRFWRAEASRHQKGLGLGLSLAETIVNIHNGTISVTSELNKGTEFIISLPIS